MHGRQLITFLDSGKKLGQGQIARLKNYNDYCKFFRRSFCIQNKAQNLSTSKYENFSLRRSTQQYIQISDVAIILNYIQNCLIKTRNMNHVLYDQ